MQRFAAGPGSLGHVTISLSLPVFPLQPVTFLSVISFLSFLHLLYTEMTEGNMTKAPENLRGVGGMDYLLALLTRELEA